MKIYRTQRKEMCILSLLLKLHQHKSSIRKWNILQVSVGTAKKADSPVNIFVSDLFRTSKFYEEETSFVHLKFLESQCFTLRIEYQTKF